MAEPKPTSTVQPPVPTERQSAETLARSDAAVNTDSPGGSGLGDLDLGAYAVGGSGVLAPQDLVNKSFDDFELLAIIGQGGMGVVYKARQKSLDRVVALKMLLGEPAGASGWNERFLTEARAVAALSHPNIVGIHQVGQCSAGRYFAMEHIEGPSLEAVLAKGLIPVRAAATLMTKVAEAVHYAHGKGIVHRDLKPANILIDKVRGPVVMDFGIAKMLGKGPGTTQEGTIMGTPSYMAPEQASEGADPIGPYTDVYSLGAILYRALTGRPPYVGSTALSTILKVISPEPPPAIQTLRTEVPAELERICLRCLRKPPAERYPSAKALADDLRSFLKATPAPLPFAQPVALPRLVLVVQETGHEVRITRPTTVIGRVTTCDVALRANDVSKRHCQIVLTGDQVIVEDLGSSNGTFINGQRIQRGELKNGDELRVGDHMLSVRM